MTYDKPALSALLAGLETGGTQHAVPRSVLGASG